MTKFICAVADCKSDSTRPTRLVKGWAMFPSKKKSNPKRRREWEMRCRRGKEWRATRYHAICSRHFIAWEKNRPSPMHPDPVLFSYNGWGKNCLKHISRKQNAAQRRGQPCNSDADRSNSDSATPPQDIQQLVLATYSYKAMVLYCDDVQDWCETEVCSDESQVAPDDKEVTVADVTPTAAPYNDHVYAHERLQPHDTVREDDETDPLASNHNTEPFSSALLVKERRAMEGRLGSNLTLQGSRVKGKGRPRGNKRLCTQTRSDALQNDSDDSTAGVIISDRDSINDIENDCGVDASTFALMNCVASLDDSVVKVEEAPANHVREPLEVYVGEDGATVTEGHDWATPGPSPTPEAGKSGDEASCSSVTHLDTMMTSLMLHGQHQEQASCLIREMMDAYKAQKMAWQAVEKYYANRSRK